MGQSGGVSGAVEQVEEHPADPFHSLDNLKSQSASVSFYRSSRAYSGRSGAVTEWPVVRLVR